MLTEVLARAQNYNQFKVFRYGLKIIRYNKTKYIVKSNQYSYQNLETKLQ